ncbi:hypothetical protein JXA88_01700 [Candidatus Fermentibacteria bacterium]|nr:hypothetical protein [Candidatus Fermentibacteria bacterium]
MLLLSLAGYAPVRAECTKWPWPDLAKALRDGDTRTIASMIGGGRVSLNIDGIPPGSYTAAQAGRLLGGFFKSTTARRVEYRGCGASGMIRWADAVLFYRVAGSAHRVEERILLEMCGSGEDAVLCGMRSASPPQLSAS